MIKFERTQIDLFSEVFTAVVVVVADVSVLVAIMTEILIGE